MKRQGNKKARLIALITVAAVLIAGLGVWGVIEFRNAQTMNEARAYAVAVQQARGDADAARRVHQERIDEARESFDVMTAPLELLRARTELFDEGTVDAFAAAMVSLEELTDQPPETAIALKPPFDHANFDEVFVEQYRAASKAERQRLAAESEDLVRRLDDLARSLAAANDELDATVLASQRAAVVVAQDLPTRVNSIVADYPEAEESVVVALRDTSTVGGLDDDTDPADLAGEALVEHVNALQDHFIVYIEQADRVRDNHAEAVRAREEAERLAAEAAEAERRAAEAAAAGGGGGGAGGGGGGHEVQILCNVWQPDFFGGGSTLVLMPC